MVEIRSFQNPSSVPDSSAPSTTNYTPTESAWDDCDERPTPQNLAIRLKNGFNAPQPSQSNLSLVLHPLPERDGIIVSVNPPKQPNEDINHVPCDIVLVIDVSGSMQVAAPVPTTDKAETENNGLSVLDLVKHAARTIVETLDKRDRLGLVTFATNAKTIFGLMPATLENKQLFIKKIEELGVEGMTNMWHGIRQGIKLFEKASRLDNIAAMMVLTDGMPNHMCPQQGYVPKLRTYNLPCAIHTFGFGYSIHSGLLKSVAEVGGGNYAFIPDAGMIGTVFVHAVAYLQSTFATNASLTLTAGGPLELAETMGQTVENGIPARAGLGDAFSTTLMIALGNIQYGQSRDIFVRTRVEEAAFAPDAMVNATLTYTSTNCTDQSQFATANIGDFTSAPPEWCQYHRNRAAICSFLSSLFPIRPSDGEHITHIGKDHSGHDNGDRVPDLANTLTGAKKNLRTLIEQIKPLHINDELNCSLHEDLCGDTPHGQISLALSWRDYFNRWGQHYLPSILNAHTRQYCNTFKDPGPLMYGRDSPLFIKCRRKLDDAFDNLPAPAPSRYVPPSPSANGRKGKGRAISARRTVHMRSYNNSAGPCFAGKCRIAMAEGPHVPLDKLVPDMLVWTPKGARRVAAVVETPLKEATQLSKLGACLVTRWHPIRTTAARGRANRWEFPMLVEPTKTESYVGSIYSIMLEPDFDPDAHAVMIEAVVGATWGHGVKGDAVADARAHPFFSDYEAVAKSLELLDKKENGVLVCGGVDKDAETGTVNGFLKA